MSEVKIYVIGETVELQQRTVNYGAISRIWLVMLLLWETGDSRREICISVNVAEN